MSDNKPKKGKSFLAKYADESDPLVPWFRDPVKLVTAALNSDTDRRKALIAGLIDLAASDETFRRQIFSKFDALGSGKKARLSMPFWQKVMLVSDVNFLRSHFKLENKPHSITDVCNAMSHRFNLTPKSFETLYYKLKKDPDVINALI